MARPKCMFIITYFLSLSDYFYNKVRYKLRKGERDNDDSYA
ncbi:hypothetical protein Runsl_1791 [Runella slithyformis DSM 19594]|uniref:Uncharacterized protein n=1 Tax=Runella slithyformis (strain ATCC 29530 / DSM 19594 / LMG 11500 / NCIMB 11436 / LSU 4) TaxID=761193 RepID=A0A7U3ZJ86_RUNSL|nr:hypothetical protein Runsl_1791 [Runella slithyformis DSM 19594]